MKFLAEVGIEIGVDIEFGIACGQQGNELFDRSRLFSLIDVAEQANLSLSAIFLILIKTFTAVIEPQI